MAYLNLNTSTIEEPDNRAKKHLNISMHEGIKCTACTTSLKIHKISTKLKLPQQNLKMITGANEISTISCFKHEPCGLVLNFNYGFSVLFKCQTKSLKLWTWEMKSWLDTKQPWTFIWETTLVSHIGIVIWTNVQIVVNKACQSEYLNPQRDNYAFLFFNP